jgi:hypothetical protein
MNYNEIFKKVFLWMFVGLLITFATGYVVSVSPNMIEKIFSSSMYIILAIIELALVIILSARITKMNPTTARILFILYSFVTGLTFSSIFIVYEMSSIIYVFLITAIVFGILSFIGYTTNVDLTKMGTYLLIGLIAVLISTIINIFVGNGTFEIIICIISVLVFLGFTAYDVQKIKQLSNYYDENSIAIIGALELYLDFINIFLDLLKLFAKERN